MNIISKIFLIFVVSSFCLSCQKKEKDKFILGFSDPVPTLNVFKMTGRSPWRATSLVFETLFKKHGGEYKPTLALSYSISKENKSLTIKLRKGVKFHNGESLTSENIKFSHNCYVDEKYGAHLWKGMFDVVDRIEIIDKHTAKIVFSKFSYNEINHILTNLRMYPLEFYDLDNKDVWSRKIVGTGPYTLQSFTPSQSLSFKKNKTWWGEVGDLNFDNVIVKKISDETLAKQIILSKKLDFFPLDSVNTYFRFKDDKRFKFLIDNLGNSYSIKLKFNLKKKIFNKAVRKAIVHSVNYDEINKKFFKGLLKNNADVFNPSLKFYPKAELISYDPKMSDKILNAEGWLDSDKNGVREKIIDGRKTEFKFQLTTTSPTQERIATYLQEELKRQGFLVEVNNSKMSTEHYKRLKDGNFDAYVNEGILANDEHVSYMHSKSFYNFGGYSNPKADVLIDELNLAFEKEERLRLLGEIIKLYREDIPESRSLIFQGKVYMLSTLKSVKSTDPYNPRFWE